MYSVLLLARADLHLVVLVLVRLGSSYESGLFVCPMGGAVNRHTTLSVTIVLQLRTQGRI